MISTEHVEKALDFLRDNAERIAKERAQRLYLEQYIKTVKATLQKRFGGSAASSEIEALSSPEYLTALQGYREAIEIDEHNRFLIAAAEAKIDAWRSMEATKRAEGKAYGP